jgi:2-hydroxy-6-oxonona-2,4-dienedioate hydrolase
MAGPDSRRWLPLTALAAAFLTWQLAGVAPTHRRRAGSFRRQRRAMRSRWTEVDGVRVHVRVGPRPARPRATPVIMVHGAIVSSLYLVPTAALLGRDRPVLVPDLPGFGRSDKPRRQLSVPELADALVAWMDAVGIRRAILLGNSLGCQVVADVAARYPKRVTHLVLVGPTTDPRRRSAWQQAARVALDYAVERPSLVPVELLDVVRLGPRRVVQTMRASLADRIERKLPRIEAPTLVVRGTRDVLCTRAWAREVTARLRRGWLVEVPGVGHVVNYSAPAALTRLVRRFLRAPSTRDRSAHGR